MYIRVFLLMFRVPRVRVSEREKSSLNRNSSVSLVRTGRTGLCL